MTKSRVPEWDPSNPKNCARAAIAIEFGQHFPNALTDIGDMDTYIYRDLDMLMNSITKVMMARCPPEMLDEIDRELVEISTDTPKDHPLVKLAGYEGTSWEYRYDTLHPFFVVSTHRRSEREAT